MRVIGRRRRLQPYGVCGATLQYEPVPCQEPMLRRKDARFVLRAALAHGRRGGNKRAEYDT